jgi:hypothetical protein
MFSREGIWISPWAQFRSFLLSMQEIHYLHPLSHSFSMRKIGEKTQSEAHAEARAQFGTILEYLLDQKGENQRQAGDRMKKRLATDVDYQSKLSKYIRRENAPTLDSMVDIASYLEVPLWMFFIEALPKEMLLSADGRRLAQIVADYVFIEDPEERIAIANAAKLYADIQRKKGTLK